VGYTSVGSGGPFEAGYQVLDKDDYRLTGATAAIDFYAIAAHGQTGMTGFVSLFNATDNVGVATLPFSGLTQTRYIATGLILPTGMKMYRANLDLGGATGPVSAAWIGFQIDRKLT
jgi:hypothetical protein